VTSPRRPWFKRFGYCSLRLLARWSVVLLYGMRAFGRTRIPRDGALLVCPNHQSHFDPVLVGLLFPRRLNFVARKSLFEIPLLRWLIAYLDAIPIDRDGMGLEGLKTSLRRLRGGEAVLIFPEGTRSPDGEVAPLHPGFCMLARRGQATLLPVGVDGAFEAWPRTALLPRPGLIFACVGEPITPQEFAEMDDKAIVAELECRIRACQLEARKRRWHAAGRACPPACPPARPTELSDA